MVHRKSEYRLQFHILTNEHRKQIWMDNLKFRESCRLTNQAHHYWTYQVTKDPCECDQQTILEEENDDAPLPPHRLKHKFLLSIYGSEDKSPEKHSLEAADAVTVSRSAKVDQQQVYIADVTQDREDPVPDRAVDVFESEVPGDTRDEVATKQLETQPSAPPLPLCSPVPEQPTPVHPVPPAPSPQFRPFQPTSSYRPSPGAVTRGVQRLPDATCSQPSPIRVSFPTPAVDYDAVHRIPPRATTRSRTGRSEAVASPSCLARPSRTTRSIFSDEKKQQCPFAAFGWNDTNKDVGDKKTYNVSAPQTQVYENALRALKKRREEIEKFLAKEAAVRGHLSACDYGVNNSSIWMSEYREKFGGGSQHPVMTTPARNLTSWRCYS